MTSEILELIRELYKRGVEVTVTVMDDHAVVTAGPITAVIYFSTNCGVHYLKRFRRGEVDPLTGVIVSAKEIYRGRVIDTSCEDAVNTLDAVIKMLTEL